MVSQAQGFVHLLAAAADGSHEPQVFRMRWDQPLKRFARAYAVFRELGAHAETALAMSTRNHGELDPSSPPGVYGLTDGDQVLFTTKVEASGAGEAASGVAASSAAKAPADGGAADMPSVQSPEARKEAGAPPAPLADGAAGEAGSALPPSSSPWEASMGFPVAKAETPVELPGLTKPATKAAAKGRGRGRAAAVKTLGKTAAKTAAARSASKGRGRGRGPAVADTLAGGAIVAASAGAKPKAKAKGKGKATLQAKPKAKGKAKAKAKAQGKAVVTHAGSKGKAASTSIVVAAAKAAPRAGDQKPAAPSVPRGLMRSTTATSGPAKGWKVTAWLQDISGHKVRAHDSIVRWRIISPCRTKTYSTFRSVQDEEGDGVYAQLYTAVRPDLLRRISSRRQILEGGVQRPADTSTGQGSHITPPPKRRRCSPAPSVPGGEKDGVVTPRPVAAPLRGKNPRRAPAAAPQMEMLATQLFAPAPKQAKAPKAAAWSCDCEAHMRRHPRCSFGGNLQPQVVHLRDYMLIGRGETCDVVLNSRLTPQMISRCHAVLHREEQGAFALVDQGSLNGLLVNGEPVTERRALANGDIVTFGVPSAQPEFDYIFEERPSEAGPRRGALTAGEDFSMAPTLAV